MTSRRYLKNLTIIFTLALMVGPIMEIIRYGFTFWASAILIYLIFVSLVLGLSCNDESKNISASNPIDLPNPGTPKLLSDDSQPKTSPKTAQEIILETIRTKGKAKRHDLLPLVKISKSTLVRLLDKMEVEGTLVQIGQKKAAFYMLPELKPGK